MRGAGIGPTATTSYCYLNCDPRPRMGDGLWIHYSPPIMVKIEGSLGNARVGIELYSSIVRVCIDTRIGTYRGRQEPHGVVMRITRQSQKKAMKITRRERERRPRAGREVQQDNQ